MTPVHHHRPELKLSQNRALLAHWETLRGDRGIPLRSDFNPMAMPAHLPHIIMLEPQLPEASVIRIFGTELAHRLGLDLTGHNLFSLYSGEELAKVRALMDAITGDGAVALVYSSWNTPSGYAFKTENLWMPLASPEGDVTRILGSVWELEAFADETVALGGSIADALDISERAFYQF